MPTSAGTTIRSGLTTNRYPTLLDSFEVYFYFAFSTLVGKVIFWIVVFFLVLLALRLVSVHQARRERREEQAQQRKPADEPMVRCGQCNVYLPKSSAVMTERGYGCGDADCAHRR